MRCRAARVIPATLLVVLALGALPSAADAQPGEPDERAQVEVRIAARRLSYGRTEFGLQQRQADGSWGPRLLSDRRILTGIIDLGLWKSGSPLQLRAAPASGGPTVEFEVRVVARRHLSKRVEFAVQHRQARDRWSGRLLPDSRFLPVSVQEGRWLVTAPLTVTVGGPTEAGDALDATPIDGEPPADSDDPDTTTGGFTEVATGYGHGCGLRSTGAITCWGDNGGAKAEPPDGRFLSVSVGESFSCGLRVGGRVECWGSNYYGTDPPSGHFTAMDAGRDVACGVRANGDLRCWGSKFGAQRDAAPTGSFSTVTVGGFHACALSTTGTIECWGDNGKGQTDAPRGRFVDVAAGGHHSCGVRADRTLACWGWNYYGQATPPSGRFIDVIALGANSCGLREDRTLACWGASIDGLNVTPGGEFISVGRSCAVRTDGAIACWGDIDPEDIRRGHGFVCGDSPSRCNELDDEYLRLEGPDGTFTAVAVGAYTTCGLRRGQHSRVLGNQPAVGVLHPDRAWRHSPVPLADRPHPVLLGAQRRRAA